MSILSREDLRSQLKRREFAPVYLLFGAETYLRDLAARAIADLVLADSSLREFNEIEFSLSSGSPIQHALAAAEQMPMISSRRVVKISNVVVSVSGGKDTLIGGPGKDTCIGGPGKDTFKSCEIKKQ
jgi:DNA polymerase III delta subunit